MTLGGDTVPYAGVRAGDDFHLVDYPCPVRLLGEVHSQVSTVGIDGCKQQMESLSVKDKILEYSLNVQYIYARFKILYHRVTCNLRQNTESIQ